MAWRCKRCYVTSVITALGGLLLCGCPDQPHTEWEFWAPSDDPGGRWTWRDAP